MGVFSWGGHAICGLGVRKGAVWGGGTIDGGGLRNNHFP